MLKGHKKVAMEYYPNGAIPYVSKVDGGVIDLVRDCRVEVVSSAMLLQLYTSVLDEFHLEMSVDAKTKKKGFCVNVFLSKTMNCRTIFGQLDC